MSVYDLPRSAVIGGIEYEIRSDYRVALDIINVMGDVDTPEQEKVLVILGIFYVDFASMPIRDFQEAVNYCIWFIGGGEDAQSAKKPKMMDWQQDFKLIISPVNKVLGYEARDVEYLHWWTFLAAYREIGDCTFAQVVSIRKKKLKGEKLDKSDQRFYIENRDLVDFKTKTTTNEQAILDAWLV